MAPSTEARASPLDDTTCLGNCFSYTDSDRGRSPSPTPLFPLIKGQIRVPKRAGDITRLGKYIAIAFPQ